MNRNEVMLGCSHEEAKSLRTALHIATRLCLLLPDGLNHKEWGEKFKGLHESLVHNNVDILDGAPDFSDNIISQVKSRQPNALLFAAYGSKRGAELTTLAFGVDSGRSTAMSNAPNKPPPPPKLWKVQFDSSPAPNTEWRDIGALGEFTSRNQAYRKMRERCKKYGYAPSLYRVVPQDTPQGKEKDRGFYTVQFMFKSSTEWKTSTRRDLSGTFPDVESAERALQDSLLKAGVRSPEQYQDVRRSYRIKWHQSKP